MTTARTELPLSRRMWRTLEPLHGLVYFAPEAEREYAALGAHGRTGYFASRSAPLGAVRADVVVATFFNFSPALVRRAMTGAWETAAPERWIEARVAGIDGALRRILGADVDGPDMREAAELARAAALAVEPHLAGRPLAAGHHALAWPHAPHLALWHAISILREFRGDGHVALLTAAGLRGIDALVVHAATGDVPAEILRVTRGWSDDDWTAAVADLAGRGLVDASGAFTAAGRAAREEIEARTDDLASAPWSVLSVDDAAKLRALVRPWSSRIVAAGDLGNLRLAE